jgi:hypothetical protein
MIWDIIEQKLAAAEIASEAEGTLFLDEMPADVRVGVLLKSPLTGIRFDPHMPGYHKPRLQVIVRHTDPVEGAAMAAAVMRALIIPGVENYPATVERGAVQLNLFYPDALPIRYPRLDGDTIEWSCNFNTSFSIQPQ